ncbi:MAG TPA: hypothetical protein VFK05_11560 [Polyangiaceae bacterium]|nr:hypothetical protein [Polyangiaceae bacterium]
MSVVRVELSAVLLLLFSVVTCAEQPMTKTSSDITPAHEHDSVGAAPAKASDSDSQAAGETCGDVACTSNSDCCKGYACGFDPERSHVQRYCLGP